MTWCWNAATAQETADGLSFDSPRLHPGKFDFLTSYTENGADQLNLFWWSQSFKGGFGIISPENGDDVEYAGGFLRPFAGSPEKGELIIGAQVIDGLSRQSEAQLEYRLPSGFGFGGGFVEREDSPVDIRFAKITYRNQGQKLQYIFAAQWQEFANESSPGGYVALYNDSWMGTWGHDGEQWRSSLGYVGPNRDGALVRPAFEILFVDNSIGDFAGPEFLFVNGTLGFRGGFLSHPARLGRAMGPTGLEYGNPLGFLNPTFNRRLNPWELGGVADFRLVRLDLPNGSRSEVWEAMVFPAQLDRAKTSLDRVFVGVVYNNPSPGDDGYRAVVGHQGAVGFLDVGLRLEYDFDSEGTNVFLGLIDKF